LAHLLNQASSSKPNSLTAMPVVVVTELHDASGFRGISSAS
jgi:hypothetical protein